MSVMFVVVSTAGLNLSCRNNTSGKHAGSLLTQKIATDQLADAFMAFNTNYHDTGLFGVYAVTDR